MSCDLAEVSVEVSGPSDAFERIRLEKLPFVHRAVSITMDSNGRNFGALQADPKTRYSIFPEWSVLENGNVIFMDMRWL